MIGDRQTSTQRARTLPACKEALPVRVPLARRPMGIRETLATARRNVLELVPESATVQPIVSGRVGRRWHMVMDPGALRTILRERPGDYPKSDITRAILQPAIGDSLFIANGAHWRWQRRAAAPAFNARHIAALAPVMSRAAEASAARIAAEIERQGGEAVIDMHEEMVAATFDIIASVTLAGEDGSRTLAPAIVRKAINDYLAAAARVSLLDLLGISSRIPRPGRLFRSGAIRRMHALAEEAIARRRRRGPLPEPDLLDLLIAARDAETGRAMNDIEIRDNLLTFIVAGHETTALALAWSFYLLAFDERVTTRAATEARSVLAGRVAGHDDLPRLGFVRQVIEEALRLYPPAAFLTRTAARHDTLLGRLVRAGDAIILPIYALHRHRLLWERPDAFDPDRFAPGHPIVPMSHLPFGDGPRVCIGARFAMTEAVIILATLLDRFHIAGLAGPPPRPVMILTLHPVGGVLLRMRKR